MEASETTGIIKLIASRGATRILSLDLRFLQDTATVLVSPHRSLNAVESKSLGPPSDKPRCCAASSDILTSELRSLKSLCRTASALVTC